MKILWLVLVLSFAMVVPGSTKEGKWTPSQLLELDPEELREMGLELDPEDLWSERGAGLLEAAVKINGCSAAFISPDGLILTNHHCAFGLLQQLSTPERDLLAEGFLAASREEELAGRGTYATIPHRVIDVTERIEAAVPEGASDLERHEAIEAERKALVAECEETGQRRCLVATYDDGVRHELVESLEFPDVRLVYAPPRAVGEYGGEVDNWSWPRHSGDFTLLRVWAAPDGSPAERAEANRPYRPRHHFPVSTRGVEAGDFVMVAGYPGRTYRAWTTSEVEHLESRYFPDRSALYQDWIALMEERSARSEEARLALASRIKGLANREKNSRGQVAGIERGRIVDAKRAHEEEVLAWAAERPDQAGAVAAHRELQELLAQRRLAYERDFLLAQMSAGPLTLDLALDLVRWAEERAKPDLERDPAYMERNRSRLQEGVLGIAQKRLDAAAEEALMTDLFLRLARLPEGQRVEAVEAFLGLEGLDEEPRRDAVTRDAVAARVAAAHEGSAVADLAAREAMFEESTEELRERRDPLLDLAFALRPQLRRLEEQDDAFSGAEARLRPSWRRAVLTHAGRPVSPDANGTLRVSLAEVAGYSPRDAVWMEPLTTVAGLVAKHTGEEPFDAPELVRKAAPTAPESRWADAELGDVPVCFLATGDTTGGNSGSPVLDGRGRLVGVNFDRVWENVANDFGYNPAIARNVSVDIRYMLWLMEAEHGEAVRGLLAEMGIPAAGDPAGDREGR